MNAQGLEHTPDKIIVSGINLEWDPERGLCTFEGLPVAMMWIDTTLRGMMDGVQAMVGTPRFLLALQSEGRKSVEADWQVISQSPDFRQGFAAIANIAAVAGWGRWELTLYDPANRECRFRVSNSWEGRYQRSMGIPWGSGFLAGKLAGYCSRLFGTNCWADQTAFIASGAEYDEFVVKPSSKQIETELDCLLATDEASRADMAIGLHKLEQEIAERKRAEAALQEREEQYRNLVETTSDWIWEIDANGKYTYASPRVRDLLGYEPAEVIGRTPFELMPPDEADRLSIEFARINAERQSFFNLENVNLHKDGSRVVLETSGVPRLDPQGNFLGYRGIDRDITARKQAEQALREHQETISAIVESSQDWIWAVDSHRVYTYSNPAVEKILGYRPEEVVGKELDLVHDEDRPRLEAFWADRRASRGGGTSVLVRWRCKDGQYRHLERNAVPIVGTDGAFLGFRGVDRDVSDRKRAEAERARLEEQLRRAHRLESIGRLAGGVAHDFNNLLTVINGYSQLILAQLDETNPLRASLEEIRKSGERAAELTRQLLAFSRKQVIAPKPVDPNQMIAECVNMLGRLLGEDVEIVTDLAPGAGPVLVDPGQFLQILMNLAVNARDAMPSGGRLKLATATKVVDSADAAYADVSPGRYALLTVSDTGTGMSEETRQSVFEPFFTTKGEGKGTGLGLSTVYGIVRQAGGWIEVDSQPGSGSTFRIGLPLLAAPDSESSLNAQPVDLQGSETVLVVEDQDEVRALIVAMLERYGLHALPASRGGEALAIAERHPGTIHLLLTDVVMPQMTGKELAARMKALRPGIRVLFMSGYTDEVLAGEDMLVPGAGYIQKPFSPAALAQKVREVLG